MNEKYHYKINISGQVQGVGFRWNAVHQARKFGINGFVKNSPDGNVFIEAEGSEPGLRYFVEWCKKGPPSAMVKSVSIDSSPLVNYPDFRIES